MSKSTLVIDGARGEGGGQIVRSALGLAALMGQSVRIERIRSGRRNPGLAAQHLTAARALAALCAAELRGDALGSQTIEFIPRRAPHAGSHTFDVANARRGGSAGAATLVLQAVLPVLGHASGRAHVHVHGGTHMAWSPFPEYVQEVWLPALARMGLRIRLEAPRTGWFPVGKGELRATIDGIGPGRSLTPLRLVHAAPLQGVRGRAIAANLPGHIPRRMAARARTALAAAGIDAEVESVSLRAACPGAGLFLRVDRGEISAGFSALGERGKPAEVVADEAVAELGAYLESAAPVDRWLGDQLLLPAALAAGESVLRVSRPTEHLRTSAWLLERFGTARIEIVEGERGTAEVRVKPREGRAHQGDGP